MRLCVITCLSTTNISKLVQERYTYHFNELKIVCSVNSRDIKVFHCNWLTIQSDDHRGYDFISDYLETRRWPNIVRLKAYMTLYFEVKQILSTILQGLLSLSFEFLSLNYIRDEMDAASTPDLPLFKNLVQLRIFLKRDDSLLFELPSKCPKFEVLQVNIMHNLSILPLWKMPSKKKKMN